VTTDRIYFGYMALIGALAGALLVAVPGIGDTWFKPYFWVLIAVAVFDGIMLLLRQNRPAVPMVSIEAKLLGFVIGIVVMVAIPTLAGSSVRFF
jgi:hypothetical protein